MKRHKEWLQNEYMRREPDLKKVEDRMALTFPDRRKLMNKKVPLTEVRAEYPALFNFKQVLHACNMWFGRQLASNNSVIIYHVK